jgi:hypothetical protein
MHACMHAYIYTYTYIHTCIHTYTHTHTHTYVQYEQYTSHIMHTKKIVHVPARTRAKYW